MKIVGYVQLVYSVACPPVLHLCNGALRFGCKNIYYVAVTLYMNFQRLATDGWQFDKGNPARRTINACSNITDLDSFEVLYDLQKIAGLLEMPVIQLQWKA